MKFKIKKEVDDINTWYWTEPQGFLNRLWWIHLVWWRTRLVQETYDVWLSLERAKEHIKRWNSGYYKKRYYSKYV